MFCCPHHKGGMASRMFWVFCCVGLLLPGVFAFRPAPPAALRPSRPLRAWDASLLTAAADGVNAWSVAGPTLNSQDIASSLFAVSLFPYLAFLYLLENPRSQTPGLAKFGFQFLLFFVFATIPAGIYAKTQYHDILANVDWLHGSAESMLTVANLLLIFGFRSTRPRPSTDPRGWERERDEESPPPPPPPFSLNDGAIPILLAGIASSGLFAGVLPQLHIEPANALSIPTWMVHSSSLFEWLVAMELIWQHAETSGNPRWKGLTWAMIPSHTSGICACTYHFFFNAPILSWIVSLQAGLTVLGNFCLALAAYRISQYPQAASPAEEAQKPPSTLPESDAAFMLEIFVKSLALALAVKYGSLAIDLPFIPLSQGSSTDPSPQAAAIILLPTFVVAGRWLLESSRNIQDRKGGGGGEGRLSNKIVPSPNTFLK